MSLNLKEADRAVLTNVSVPVFISLISEEAGPAIVDECLSSCAHCFCRCRFIPDTPLGQPPHIDCTCAANLLSELEFVVPVHRIYLQLTLGQNVLCLCSDSEQPSSAHNRCTGCSDYDKA